MSSTTPEVVLAEALAVAVRERHDRGAFGVILSGIPALPLAETLRELGKTNQLYVSVVGAPDADALLTWARDQGWSEEHFGLRATHATAVRNHAPSDALKVVIVWREEDRLHSLTRRGYELVGPAGVIQKIAARAENDAPNEPQKALWRALASPRLSAYLSVDAVLDYYVKLRDSSFQADSPRQWLPILGMLIDPQLLTERYVSEESIVKRLLLNAAIVDRIQRADEEDREKAAQSVRSAADDEREVLEKGYSAFLRIARSDLSSLADLSVEMAERLLGAKKTRNGGRETPPAGDENDEAEGKDTEKAGTRWREFPTLAAAAIHLAGRAEFGILQQLVEQASEQFRRDDQQTGQLQAGDVRVQIATDEGVLALGRKLIGPDRFGGRLHSTEVSTDALLQDLARHLDQFQRFDEVRLRTLEDVLQRAEGISAAFEGASLLRAYLEQRAVLVPWLDLLTASPLACLVAIEAARVAVREAIHRYERLLSHLDENFLLLRRQSVDGTTILYNEILSLDLIRIQGEDEVAALLAPVNPLVLWKYSELADLVLSRGADLPESDQELLTDEIADLPEPLLALHAPGDTARTATALAFAGRIGSMPVYRPNCLEEAGLSERSLRIAGTKLLALYPPAREHLRLLLVDPVSTQGASKALKSLIQKQGVQRATLVLAHTARHADRIAGDSALDEINSEGRVTIEEVSVPSMEVLRAQLSRRPVHVLGIAGMRQRNVQLVEAEGTRLHPLSLPHRLHADPLLRTVSLEPRSIQPAEEAPRHPFGYYHRIVSQLSGNHHSELSMGRSQRLSLSDYRPVYGYCQLVVASGDLPEGQLAPELLRLTQGVDLAGDSVFTYHRERILKGMDALLRQMNYQPSKEGLEGLLRHIQEIGGEGIFAAVSEKSVNGFSPSALRGQLGLAVTLNWYKARAAGGRHILISLDSYLARKWLRRREDGKRSDLLGIRQLEDGGVSVDLIEVKSYEATDEEVADSHPGQQLRSVARLLYDMFSHQGDILIDRRRELLRLQIFREGLLPRSADVSPDWIESLNDVLDGKQEASIKLTLMELAFGQNIEPDDREFEPAEAGLDPVTGLPIRRIKIGERDIRRHLEGVLQGTEPDAPEQPVRVEGVTTAPDAGERGTPDGEPEQDSPPGPDETAEEPPATGGGATAPRTLGFEPSDEERQEIERAAKTIYRVLRDIGVELAGEVDAGLADVGPSIVRYKVRLKTGERVQSLQSRARDLMRELATEKEPMIDNLPNTNFVYIDVPRSKQQPALFRPVLEALHEGQDGSGLNLPVGVTPDGKVEWLDLTVLPHMLVAGSTGSGKTMFLYSLIVGLARLYGPSEVQLLLVDPKETDFVFFDALPHLRGAGVIADPRAAVEALNQLLTDELESRTARLKKSFSRDIKSYNERHPGDAIAPIVVMIDEFADLADVMDKAERDQFDLNIRRLAQRARNVGIHLILATQRPTADIVKGTLKSNLPCRVSFRLASSIDSRTILDRSGAEQLLGNGDMLVNWNGRSLRLQGFLLPDDDIVALLGLDRG